jgi:hypothetical protein
MYGSANKAKTALYCVAVLFGGLAAFCLIDIVFSGEYPARKSAVLSDPRPKWAAGAGKRGLADFAAIRADKFCGPGAEGLNSTLGGDAGFRVRGVIVHSDPARSLAFIEVLGEAEQTTARAGDSVKGAKILAIDPNFVEFEIAGKPVRINLYEVEESVPPPPAAPPGVVPPPVAGAAPVPEFLNTLPPAARDLWVKATPEQRDQFMKMSPEEQKKAVRQMLKKNRPKGGAGDSE